VLDHILPEDWRDIDDHAHDHDYEAGDTAAIEAEVAARDRAAESSRRRSGRHGA
jgi:hypothetical protein